MSTWRIIVPCHAVFDESEFPFTAAPSAASVLSSLDFLIQGLSPLSETLPSSVERPRAPLVAPCTSEAIHILIDCSPV
jgi:hypothetical protein